MTDILAAEYEPSGIPAAPALEPIQTAVVSAVGRLHSFCEHMEHLELESAMRDDAPGAVEVLRLQVHEVAVRRGVQLGELVAQRLRIEAIAREVDESPWVTLAATATTWQDLQVAVLFDWVALDTGMRGRSRYDCARSLALRVGVLTGALTGAHDPDDPTQFTNDGIGDLAICVSRWATVLGLEFSRDELVNRTTPPP